VFRLKDRSQISSIHLLVDTSDQGVIVVAIQSLEHPAMISVRVRLLRHSVRLGRARVGKSFAIERQDCERRQRPRSQVTRLIVLETTFDWQNHPDDIIMIAQFERGRILTFNIFSLLDNEPSKSPAQLIHGDFHVAFFLFDLSDRLLAFPVCAGTCGGLFEEIRTAKRHETLENGK
jgi:hypothetical protein